MSEVFIYQKNGCLFNAVGKVLIESQNKSYSDAVGKVLIESQNASTADCVGKMFVNQKQWFCGQVVGLFTLVQKQYGFIKYFYAGYTGSPKYIDADNSSTAAGIKISNAMGRIIPPKDIDSTDLADIQKDVNEAIAAVAQAKAHLKSVKNTRDSEKARLKATGYNMDLLGNG